MKRLFSWGLAFCFWTGSLYASDQALYQFHGKTYTSKDLTPALKQAAYDLERQTYENLQKIIDAQLLEDHARAEAKKKNMTLEKYEEQYYKGKKPADKEAKAWFEANKARLGGREFDSIKNDILQLLQSQADEKVRSNLLSKIKADGKFQFAMSEPQVPVVEINTSGFPTKGNAKAKVSIVEFADYRCPHCVDASKALKTLFEKYKDKVQFTFLDFPLQRMGVSKKISEGGVCADQQKKFWEYHYMAWDEKGLSDNSPLEFAKKLKLDLPAFETCLKSAETAKKVESARLEGERIGVDGTPAIFFNGRKVYGHNEKMLEEILKKLL